MLKELLSLTSCNGFRLYRYRAEYKYCKIYFDLFTKIYENYENFYETFILIQE